MSEAVCTEDRRRRDPVDLTSFSPETAYAYPCRVGDPGRTFTATGRV